jgi:hypothetical protein
MANMGVLVDADADAAAGEDLGGQDDVSAEVDVAGGVQARVTHVVGFVPSGLFFRGG